MKQETRVEDVSAKKERARKMRRQIRHAVRRKFYVEEKIRMEGLRDQWGRVQGTGYYIRLATASTWLQAGAGYSVAPERLSNSTTLK